MEVTKPGWPWIMQEEEGLVVRSWVKVVATRASDDLRS